MNWKDWLSVFQKSEIDPSFEFNTTNEKEQENDRSLLEAFGKVLLESPTINVGRDNPHYHLAYRVAMSEVKREIINRLAEAGVQL